MGARFSAPVQTGPGAHPSSFTMGTRSFPEVKRPGRGLDHPPPSSAEVKERVELYLYSPSGPSWPVLRVKFTLLFTYAHPLYSFDLHFNITAPSPPHTYLLTVFSDPDLCRLQISCPFPIV